MLCIVASSDIGCSVPEQPDEPTDLINLLTNATDAAEEPKELFALDGRRAMIGLEVLIEDEGPGLPDTTNLCVPFLLMLGCWLVASAPSDARQSRCADCHFANPQADPDPDHLLDWER